MARQKWPVATNKRTPTRRPSLLSLYLIQLPVQSSPAPAKVNFAEQLKSPQTVHFRPANYDDPHGHRLGGAGHGAIAVSVLNEGCSLVTCGHYSPKYPAGGKAVSSIFTNGATWMRVEKQYNTMEYSGLTASSQHAGPWNVSK